MSSLKNGPVLVTGADGFIGSHVVEELLAKGARDLSFVRDTATGLIAALEAGDAATGEVINLGSGFEIAIGDLAREIAEIAGAPLAIECDQQRLRPAKSEVERLVSDNGKAARLLGWRPERGGVDGLRRGLKETIDWFRAPENLALYKAGAYNR